MKLLDPKVEWVPVSALLEGTQLPRPRRGAEMDRGYEAGLDDLRVEAGAGSADLGDGRVLVLGSWRAQGRGGDVALDFQQAAWLVRVPECGEARPAPDLHRSKQALEAAGLRE